MKDLIFQKNHAKFLVLALLLLFVGYYLGGGEVSLPLGSNDGPVCKTFCEAIPGTEYAFTRNINGAAHCFCQQELRAYDFDNDRTLVWKQAVDAGIITESSVENSIPESVREQREQQLRLQQDLLRQGGQ